MRPTHANAFRITVENGKIRLDLGLVAPASQSDLGGVVTLSDRVLIGEKTAARLLHVLSETLARLPEETPESLEAAHGASRKDPLTGPSGLGVTPVNLPQDPTAEASSLLLNRISALGVPYQYERSFRMAAGTLWANRFLTSMNRFDLGESALERVLEIGTALGMPEAIQTATREQFDLAHCLHFGFESSDGTTLCKLYLERKVPDEEITQAASQGDGVLLHLAFKWDIRSGDHVVTSYDWFPGLSKDGIQDRLLSLYRERVDSEPARIACDALSLTGLHANTLQYLEAHEAGNKRHSFDLNLYDTGLQMRDILPLLMRMRDHYAIRPGQFQALIDQIKLRSLGHLAGGLHRDGRDFFNVYYGVSGFPQFASRLG
jgi:tryptophan halogenase